MAMVAKKVIYSGNVQGVGFRYTAQHLAGSFAVAGYVHNLASGEVELVIEGAQDQVDAFLTRIGQAMGRYIQSTSVQEEAEQGLQGFRIRH